MKRFLFAGLAFFIASAGGAWAQDRTLEYQLAAENNITFYAVIWDCKTANAEQALADTQREIQQVRDLMDSLTTRVGFVTVKIDPGALQGEERAKYNAYLAILRRLTDIADALGKLPACPEPPKRTGAKFEWTGFYLGAGGGGNWTKGDWTTNEVVSLGGRDPLVDAVKSLYKADPFVGLYFGYMLNIAEAFGLFNRYGWQYCPVCDDWYLGFEYDFDWIDAAMDPGIPGTGGLPGNKSSDSVTVRAKWDMAVRARLAYLATPSTQLFVAGGPAWLHEDATVNCTAAGVCGTNGIPSFTQTTSTTKVGWTFGGGVEQKIWERWRARLEYRYSDYGTWSTNFGTPSNLAVGAGIKLHTQSVMAGIGYRF